MNQVELNVVKRLNPLRKMFLMLKDFFSGIPIVFTDVEYRIIFITLLLLGIAGGSTIPYVTIWAMKTYGVSTVQAAMIFVPMSIVGLSVSLITAFYSDYLTKRKPIILTILVTGTLCRFALAYTDSYSIAMIVFALTGINAFSFIFAYLNDLVRRKESPDQNTRIGTITGTERAALSFGWLFGPVLGATIISKWFYPSIFIVSGVLFLTALICVSCFFKEPTLSQHPPPNAKELLKIPKGLIVLSIAGLLIFTGDSARSMFLPLYITESLGHPVTLVGTAFTATVICELFFMPFTGYLADKYGIRKLFLIGLVSQVIYFFLIGLSSAYWQVVILQLFYAFIIAITMGVGIVYAQNLFPKGIGIATTAYLASWQVSPLISSLGIGTIAQYIPLPLPFYGAALLTIIGIILVVIRVPLKTEH